MGAAGKAIGGGRDCNRVRAGPMQQEILIVAPGLSPIGELVGIRNVVGDRDLCAVGKVGIGRRESSGLAVEPRIARIDREAGVPHFADLDDCLLADEWKCTVCHGPQVGLAILDAILQADRDLDRAVAAGLVPPGKPARLILLQFLARRAVQPVDQLLIGCRHLAICAGKPGVTTNGALDRRRSPGTLETRARLRRCRRCREPRDQGQDPFHHTRLQALSRRTASSISAVEPAKEMRSVPAPRARSKSTPGVVATPASFNIRLQNSRLSLVR